MADEFSLLAPHAACSIKSSLKGDIFSNQNMLGSQCSYHAWHLLLSDANLGRRERAYKISFRHNFTSGVWILIINGEIKARNCEKVFNKVFVVSFKLFGHLFELTVQRTSNLMLSYLLNVDGHQTKEIREKADISVDEPIPSFVEITEVKECKIDGKHIIMYQLCSHISSGEKVYYERRFSDFVQLNSIIVGLTGKHLRSTLPVLPNKVVNPFFDQTCKDFTSIRRAALERYLKNILTNSKVALYTEVFCFLGLDPITCLPLDIAT